MKKKNIETQILSVTVMLTFMRYDLKTRTNAFKVQQLKNIIYYYRMSKKHEETTEQRGLS